MSSGFEWLCLIPPLFIIVWAVVTKKNVFGSYYWSSSVVCADVQRRLF